MGYIICVTTFKEVTFELRAKGGNRENHGTVWISVFQMGQVPRSWRGSSENYSGNDRGRPEIQGFLVHAKLLKFYSKSNRSHRSLF